jgi:hypothetical protein
MTGVIAGVAIATTLKYLTDAPLIVHALVIILTGGASLLPDLDHPSATAARSLGFLTKGLAVGVDRFSLLLYHATRTDKDVRERKSGHRLLTHTVPGFLMFSAVSAFSCFSSITAGIFSGLMAGLLSLGLRKSGGFLLFLIAGGVGWYVIEHENAWWWVFPVCVFTGSLIHTLGDTITNSGTPITYPLTIKGRRWGLTTTPVTFAAGSATELVAVRFSLVVAVIISFSLYFGFVEWMIGL